MRANRRPNLTPREAAILMGAALAGAAILAALVAANIRWSAELPGGGSFYSIWAASREFLFDHGDPYSASAAARAQELAYGSAASSSQNPHRLDLPFFIFQLFLPLGMISDPNAARGIWATLAEMALVGAILISARLVHWSPPRAWLFALPLLAMFSYPTVSALVEGSAVALLLLVYVSVVRLMQLGHEELAGALAVLTLSKWEVGLPFLVILALHSFHERRWRVAAGFGMALTILLSLAFLVYQGWFMPFLVGTVAMMRSGHGVSTQSALLELVPAWSSRPALVFTGVIVLLLAAEAFTARGMGSRRFAWAACLALTAASLIGLRSELANLVMAVPGLVMIAAGGSQRRPFGLWISLCLLAVLFAVPWVIAIRPTTLPSAHAEALIFLLVPSVSMIGMYWTRWWFLKSARTWMDEVREAR